MHYLMGDVQGCCSALDALLEKVGFSKSRDHLTVLGDLVNRGPRSLATLQRLRGLEASATCLLGNHDLHLLAASHGVRKPSKGDTLTEILDAPDVDALIDWLRHRPLAVQAEGWLCVHAGVVPQWTVTTTLKMAEEVEQQLRGPNWSDFLKVMYGNEPARWDESLSGNARLRFAANVFTRIRFVDAAGTMEFASKDGSGAPPPGHTAWFDAPGRLTQGVPIAFGHWSTLGLVRRPDLLALDTGCVWGGQLSAARVDGGRCELVQVDCEQAQRPF
ncbi:MAG: symmetrical bis(5'-nucleosyl)-tetraphosphatase [Pseudorhodobacter sp.]|nr:symmetrical bis(5'-nucleosyl)-tetraphosphatase [Rhizobacter sp.]